MYLEFVFLFVLYLRIHKQTLTNIQILKAYKGTNTNKYHLWFPSCNEQKLYKKRKKVLEHIKSEMLERRKTIFTS